MFDVYLRRRAVTVALVGLLVLAGLRFAAPSSGAGGDTAYVVQQGDTLWSIAASRFDGDPRAAVRAIREANELAASEPVWPGQELILPTAA
jgi:nucleoid-associated protein YgaU